MVYDVYMNMKYVISIFYMNIHAELRKGSVNTFKALGSL